MKVFAVCFVVGISANAQSLHSFGIGGGPVLAQQDWRYASGLSTDHIKPVWGFEMGSFLGFVEGRYLSLEVGVHYVQKGRIVEYTSTVPANNPQGFVDLGLQRLIQRFDYISIPVLARMYLGSNTFNPYVTAGPSLEYLVRRPSGSPYDDFSKYELAMSVSIGATVQGLLEPQVFFELRSTIPLGHSLQNMAVTVKTWTVALLFGLAVDLT